jgi:hypothetical protein
MVWQHRPIPRPDGPGPLLDCARLEGGTILRPAEAVARQGQLRPDSNRRDRGRSAPNGLAGGPDFAHPLHSRLRSLPLLASCVCTLRALRLGAGLIDSRVGRARWSSKARTSRKELRCCLMDAGWRLHSAILRSFRLWCRMTWLNKPGWSGLPFETRMADCRPTCLSNSRPTGWSRRVPGDSLCDDRARHDADLQSIAYGRSGSLVGFREIGRARFRAGLDLVRKRLEVRNRALA